MTQSGFTLRFISLKFHLLAILLLVFYTDLLSGGAGQPEAQEVVDRMMDQVKRNLDHGEDYGSTQRVTIKKLDDEEVDDVDCKTYRTIWISGKPYNELIRVNDRALTSAEKSEELKRKQKFVDSLRKPGKDGGIVEELKGVQWWEIHTKYDFTLLPPEEGAAYVLTFSPKKTKLPERNRAEKILNHLRGKIWLDEDYNVVKASTTLNSPVRFMIGIAKLDEMRVQFQQQEMQGIFLPASLHVTFKAHAGFLKKEHQDITASWQDLFPRFGAGASSPGTGSKKR